MTAADSPPKLLCAWCDLNGGFDEPLFPHDHHDGQIPVTACRPCSMANHAECDPRAPWWCACSHSICRDLRMT